MIEVYDAIGTPLIEGLVVCHPVGGKYSWGMVVSKVTEIKKGIRVNTEYNRNWKSGDGFESRYIKTDVDTIEVTTTPLESNRKSRTWTVDDSDSSSLRIDRLVVAMNQAFTNDM